MAIYFASLKGSSGGSCGFRNDDGHALDYDHCLNEGQLRWELRRLAVQRPGGAGPQASMKGSSGGSTDQALAHQLGTSARTVQR
ncbi:hypothetical protein ABZ570_33735, partial [Micromonospora sp. NPDC007271]|uniref:hypothetical protein n=1 Tax=Micromonospora sp. NPDC007271 TaxID=3154587 RepID=UPI0033DB5832